MTKSPVPGLLRGLGSAGVANPRVRLAALAALAAAAVVLGPGAVGPVAVAPAATPAAELSLTSLALDRTAVAPRGLVAQTVTVSVGLSSVRPVDAWCGYSLVPPVGPTVTLVRTTPTDPRTVGMGVPDRWTALLDLASGDERHGVWRASIAVPSTWSGSWEVSQVAACVTPVTSDGATAVPVTALDPRALGHPASLVVTGSHVPRLSAGTVPTPIALSAPRFTAKGRLTDTDTGLGLAGVRLLWCGDVPAPGGMDALFETCTGTYFMGDVWWPYIGHSVVTDAAGYWSVTWPADGAFREVDLWVRPPSGNEPPGFLPPKFLTRVPEPVVTPALTARPRAVAVPAGAPVTVDGSWFGRYRCSALARHEVDLQYLVGRSAWRTLARTTSRPGGRWTALVAARPGRVAYRAFHPGSAGRCGVASSTPFVVLGD